MHNEWHQRSPSEKKTVLVPYNRKDKQSLSLKIKGHQVKTYEGDLQKLGHPANCNHKRNSSGKKIRDNKIKKK